MSVVVQNFETALRLLPHGEELRLIAEVLEHGPGTIVCRAVARCPESMSVLVADGQRKLSPMSFVEYVSQAAAIGKIMQSVAAGDASQRHGAVVRVRNFDFAAQSVGVDAKLEISATWSSSVAGAFEVKGSVVDAVTRSVLGSGSLFIVEFGAAT